MFFPNWLVFGSTTKRRFITGMKFYPLVWFVYDIDSFHLCLSNFPFIYQFHFLMTTLVKSAFWNPADLLIFKSFQQHFSIISKFVCCGFYIKKDVAFTLISFALLKWHQCLSVQLPFELPVEIPVQLHLELEVNLLVQNVNELEFELSRM